MEFIGFILMLWIAIAGVYYLCVGLFRMAVILPFIASFIICLPVMPFIVAYRNRKEHPRLAKGIYWMWGIVYVLIAFIWIMEATH